MLIKDFSQGFHIQGKPEPHKLIAAYFSFHARHDFEVSSECLLVLAAEAGSLCLRLMLMQS